MKVPQILKRINKRLRYFWLPNKIEDTDLLIKKINNSIENVKFIQIGANDGITDDPIRKYILNHNWKGVLVEPNASVFESLKKIMPKYLI